ncbi:MAG: hypothetical protein ACR2KW_11820 [Rubrobacter sp.]
MAETNKEEWMGESCLDEPELFGGISADASDLVDVAGSIGVRIVWDRR